eukprot:gene15772-biopygen4393
MVEKVGCRDNRDRAWGAESLLEPRGGSLGTRNPGGTRARSINFARSFKVSLRQGILFISDANVDSSKSVDNGANEQIQFYTDDQRVAPENVAVGVESIALVSLEDEEIARTMYNHKEKQKNSRTLQIGT